jgi:hypothetical protein
VAEKLCLRQRRHGNERLRREREFSLTAESCACGTQARRRTIAAMNSVLAASETDDLVLRHDDGTFQLQQIQNSVVTSTVNLGQVGNEWFII